MSFGDVGILLLTQWPRFAVAAMLLWGVALVAQQIVPRLRVSGATLRRSWLMAGASSTGIGLWCAMLCGISAVTDSVDYPTPGVLASLAALPACVAGMALVLLAARAKRSERKFAGAAGSVAALIGTAGTWAFSLGIALPGRDPIGFALLLVALVGGTWMLVQISALRHRRRDRSAAPSLTGRDLLEAAGLAAALLPTVLTLSMTLARASGHALVPEPPRFGPELMTAMLTAMMLALVQSVLVLERRLSDKHRALSRQLDSVSQTLAQQPLSDALTGLPSRAGFEQALQVAGAQAQQHNGRVAVLIIGLDGFKTINGSFGHADGDITLKAYARRLTESLAQCATLRATGPHQVARIGGDEFAVLMKAGVSKREVAKAADKLLGYIAQPVQCGDREVTLTCSIGVSLFPDHGRIDALMHQADAAMHAAKETGGATYMFFDSRMREDARERIELLRDLRKAIEQHQLELFFQPKIDAQSEQVTAAEALLRWQHPTRGNVSPEIFIPLAERYGLIVSLGNWVIEEACRQARVWRDAGLRMRVAINLSSYQMRQDDLVDRITSTLKTYGIKPERLTCEITESVAMEDTKVTQMTFERLGRAGIHLSIDDFGTGYSSLAYLRKLPASEIKIDRSFVMDLETSREAQEIVEAVIRLAHALKLKVVAEGVETPAQRNFLTEKGCHEMQGYLFARPMSGRALLMWAADDRQRKSNFRESLFAPTGATVDPNSIQHGVPPGTVRPRSEPLPMRPMPPAPMASSSSGASAMDIEWKSPTAESSVPTIGS